MSTSPRVMILGLAVFSLLFAAPDAEARRRRRKSADGPLKTAVVPFEGENAGGTPIAESVELELELVEYVVVKSAKRTKRDLRRAGASGFKPKTLSKIMRKRGVDVVIRGVREPASRGRRDKLHVYAYGADGRPRAHFELPLPGRRVDDAAVKIVQELTPSLREWSRLRPLDEAAEEAPRRTVARAEPKPAPGTDPKPAVAEDDLFVDFDEDGADDDKPKRRVEDEPNVDDILASDDPPPARDPPREERRRRASPDGGRRVLAAAADDDEDDGRRSLLTDEDDDESLDERRARRRRSILGDDEEDDRRPRRRRLSSDESEPSDIPRTSFITVETFGGGAIWLHDLKGKIADQSFSPGTLSKGGAGSAATAWFKPFIGVTADLRWMLLPNVNLGDAGLSPPKVSTNEINAGLTAKLRYVNEGPTTAFAVGGRLGYRFNLATVEPQLDDRNNPLTLIPGWQYHAGALGAEAYLAFIAANRRFEVELHGDLLLPQYQESPDNPGASVVAFGWDAGLSIRIPIVQPVFVVVNGFTGGVVASFDGTGDRVGLVTNEDGTRSPIAGGTVFNTTTGGGLGLGIFF